MTTITVAGVVEKPADAQRIIDELQKSCLCDRSDISLLHRDAAHMSEAVKRAIDSSATAVSSIMDVLFQSVSAVSRSVPGGGMLRAAGEFGARVAHAGIGSGAGIAKALVDAGVPKTQAERLGEGMDQGGILIVVQAKTEKIAQCARTVMSAHGATEPEKRAA